MNVHALFTILRVTACSRYNNNHHLPYCHQQTFWRIINKKIFDHLRRKTPLLTRSKVFGSLLSSIKHTTSEGHTNNDIRSAIILDISKESKKVWHRRLHKKSPSIQSPEEFSDLLSTFCHVGLWMSLSIVSPLKSSTHCYIYKRIYIMSNFRTLVFVSYDIFLFHNTVLSF